MVHFLRSSLIVIKSSPRLAGALSWVLALIIIVLSLTPLQQLPEVPGGDKTHHLIAYAALAFPNALARPGKIFFFGLIYAGLGGGIELIQPYANRYGSWLDFAANLGGVSIGTVCGLYLARYLARYPDGHTPEQHHS
ncbi:VanZ family protein [Alphaproteobacteria bacterium LSUCC0684]